MFFFPLNIFGPSSVESMDTELADTECCRYGVLIMFCFWLKFFFLSFGEEEDMVDRNLTQVKKKKERIKRLLINSHNPIMRI